MKKITLVSYGYKILGLLMTPLTSIFSYCLLFLVDDKNVFIYIFALIILIFFWYALFVVFYSKIIIEENKMILKVFYWFKPKKYILSYSDIISFKLDFKLMDINVFRVETKNKIISFTGFNSLKGYKKNLKRSKEIVDEINALLRGTKRYS